MFYKSYWLLWFRRILEELGYKRENITIKDTNINGYKGKKVRISFPDGTLFIANFIDYNGNIYFVSQEGLPEYENELSEVINTWNPVK